MASSLQALLKINDTFFYATTYNGLVIYNYQFNGQTTLKVAYIHVDSFQRRWVMVPHFGLIIYDQWGNFLGKWNTGVNHPFDIFIFNDYRLIIAENGIVNLKLYDPQVGL